MNRIQKFYGNLRWLTKPGIAAGMLFLCSGIMHANVVQGTIIGIFSNPVLAGVVTHDPTLGPSALTRI